MVAASFGWAADSVCGVGSLEATLRRAGRDMLIETNYEGASKRARHAERADQLSGSEAAMMAVEAVLE